MFSLKVYFVAAFCLSGCTKEEEATSTDTGSDEMSCPDTIPESAGDDAVCCIESSDGSGFSFARNGDYVCDMGDEVTIYECWSDGSSTVVDTCDAGTYCNIEYVDENDDGYNETVYECGDSPSDW